MNNLSDIFDSHKKAVIAFIDGVRDEAYEKGKADGIREFLPSTNLGGDTFELRKETERRMSMTEHDDNRVHYLVEACEVRGHLDIKPDDLSLILIHQRELGKEDALAHLAEHDKEVRRKFAEWIDETVYFDCDYCDYAYGSGCKDSTTCVDNLLNAYEKEQKGEAE